MSFLFKKKLFRRITWVVGTCLALLLAIHWSLPYVANLPKVHDGIAALAAEAFPAKIHFHRIEPAILPTLRIKVDQVGIKPPGKMKFQLDEAIIYPKIWPLLTGRFEIRSLEVFRPSVDIELSEKAPGSSKETEPETRGTFQTRVSRILVEAAARLGSFDARIDEGSVRLVRGDQIPVEVSGVNTGVKVSAERIRFEAQGSANLVAGFKVSGYIDPRTLDANGRLSLTGLQIERLRAVGYYPFFDHLPVMAVDMDLALKSKALERFEVRFTTTSPSMTLENRKRRLTIDGVNLDGSARWSRQQMEVTVARLQTSFPQMNWSGALSWSESLTPPSKPIQITLKGTDLDIAQVRGAVMSLYGDDPDVREVLDIVRGGIVSHVTVSTSASEWSQRQLADQLRVEGDLTAGRIGIPADRLVLEDVSGHVVISQGRLNAQNAAARLGNSTARKGSFAISLYDDRQVFTLDSQLDLDLAEVPETLKKLIDYQAFLDAMDRLPAIAGRASCRLVLGDRLDSISAGITAKAKIKVLDADMDVSGTVKNISGSGDATLKVSLDGIVGERTVAWLARLAQVPSQWLPKTPFSILGAQVQRDSTGGFGINGSFEWPHGLRVSVDATRTHREFRINQLRVKDAVSDARVYLRSRGAGHIVDAGFRGELDKTTLSGIFKDNKMISGWVRGNIQAHIDPDAPQQTSVTGSMSAREVILPLQNIGPVRIVEASLAARDQRLEIQSATLAWDQGTLEVSGATTVTPNALELDLRAKTKTLDVTPIVRKIKAAKADAGDPASKKSQWMTIRGGIAVEIGELIFENFKSPLQADIILGDQDVQVTISEADFCGIQMPGRVRIGQERTWMEFNPHAVQSTLQEAGRCFVQIENTEKLVGTINVQGRVSTQGATREEVLTNLKGNINLGIEDGRVYNVGKAGVFTNLLTYLSVNQYVKGEMPDLQKDEFNYKSLKFSLTLHDGDIWVEESVLKSNSVNIVSSGHFNMLSEDLDLVVLVSPLTTVDWIVERIPILGRILRGTLIALPVSVKGPVKNPKVLPLSPSAVGARMGDILKRTLDTPVHIIEPIFKQGANKPKSNEKQQVDQQPEESP